MKVKKALSIWPTTPSLKTQIHNHSSNQTVKKSKKNPEFIQNQKMMTMMMINSSSENTKESKSKEKSKNCIRYSYFNEERIEA